MKRYAMAMATAFACLFSSTYAQNAQEGPAYREATVPENAYIKAPAPAWTVPASIPETSLTGPVVARLVDTQFMADKTPSLFLHKVVQINDAAALSDYGQLSLEFIPQYQTLALHTLRIIRNKATIDKRDTAAVRFLQRETGLENGVYSGVMTASILIDDLRVGDMLEVAYSITGANPVFGNRYSEAAGWYPQLPVGLRRVILNYPIDKPIRYRFLSADPNQKAPAPERSQQGNMTHLTFTQRDMEAIHDEPNTPPGFDSRGWLQFSEYQSWSEVAQWANGLFSDGAEAKGEFGEELKRLQAAGSTEQNRKSSRRCSMCAMKSVISRSRSAKVRIVRPPPI